MSIKAALEAARDALKVQNEWHATYDEYDGYPESALSDQTHDALKLVEIELAKLK